MLLTTPLVSPKGLFFELLPLPSVESMWWLLCEGKNEEEEKNRCTKMSCPNWPLGAERPALYILLFSLSVKQSPFLSYFFLPGYYLFLFINLSDLGNPSLRHSLTKTLSNLNIINQSLVLYNEYTSAMSNVALISNIFRTTVLQVQSHFVT